MIEVDFAAHQAVRPVGAYGSVTVRSPFTLAVEQLRADYAVASTAQRHPPRGRPRKQLVTA